MSVVFPDLSPSHVSYGLTSASWLAELLMGILTSYYAEMIALIVFIFKDYYFGPFLYKAVLNETQCSSKTALS